MHTPYRPCPALVLLLLFLSALGLSSNPGRGQTPAPPVEFNTTEAFAAGTDVRNLTTGDFNLDGELDLFVLDRESPSGLFLNDGMGGFVRTDVQTVPRGDSAFAGDFDSDNRLDLAVAAPQHSVQNGVWIHLGRGDGSFEARFKIPGFILPADLGGADFDRDGNLDLFARSESEGAIQVTFGDGNGGFSTPATVAASSGIQDLVAVDLNEDSNPDLLAGQIFSSPGIFVLLRDGAGNFLPPSFFPGIEAASLETGDFNNDGHADVLAGKHLFGDGSFDADLYRGNGRGRLTLTQELPVGSFHAAALADFDGDGNLDAAFFEHRESLTVYAGDGTGRLSRPKTYGINRSISGLAADFSGDGIPDLVSASDLTGTYSLLRGDGTGRFDGFRVSLRRDIPREDQRTGDLNGDGHLDLVSAGPQLVYSLLGGGLGGVGPELVAYNPPGTFKEMELGDVDGDGLLDVIVLNSPDHAFSVGFGDGDGTFSGSLVVELGSLPRHMVTADFDEDGHTDVMVGTQGGTGVQLYLFDPVLQDFSVTEVADGLIEEKPYPALVEDINRDGHWDVVIHRSSSIHASYNRLTILLGDGTGNFTVMNHLTIDNQGTSDPRLPAALGDIDGDGTIDLVTWESGTRRIAIRRGSGFGTFGPRETLVDGSFYFPVLSTAELNGVAPIELIVSNGTTHSATLLVYRSDGSGGLSSTPAEIPGAVLNRIAVGDFDGDGLSDLSIAHNSDPALWVLLNRSPSFNCRTGNVNAGTGSVADVILVNGSPGHGRSRALRLAPDDPFSLSVEPSPAGGRRFALYGWIRPISNETTRALPFGLGTSCLPMPPENPSGPLRPRVIWNNISASEKILGEATRPSSPAPTTLLDLPDGTGFTGEIVFQGIVTDPGSRQGQAAVTNAVVVKFE